MKNENALGHAVFRGPGVFPFLGPLALCLACGFPLGAACGILGTKGKIRYSWYARGREVEPMKLLYAEDEGAAPAQKAALSLSGLAEQALESFLQPMEAQGITLERDIQPGVSLTADPAQLEQLLSLLLDNAVKYTGPGGRIRLSVKQEGKRARLCLENTCPQLPTVPPEKLFDRFYRGDAARTQKEGGYGIGLAVARSLAQANQGSLHAQYLPPQAIRFVAQFPN